MENNVLIIGGLGFIGFHIAGELKQNNYNVSIGSRTSSTLKTITTPIIHINLQQMSDTEIEKKISQFDYIIFAGGADDRVFLNETALPFFYKENVTPCVRLATISRNLKTQKIIILGSYFTYFNRTRPEWKMAEQHPYIKSRVLQYRESAAASENKTHIIVLEIPYVFGATPEKTPLWKPLIKYIKKAPMIFYTKGGTNIMSVEQVAKATLGVIENTQQSDCIVIGNQNVTWKQMIGMISKTLHQNKHVISVPTNIVRLVAFLARLYFHLFNKQTGLDVYHFIKIQTATTFLDTKASMNLLNYKKADMQKAIDETVKACKL